MEYEKRAAIVVALRAERTPPEIANFLKLPRSLVYRVKKQFDAVEDEEEFQPSRKKHSRRSDAKRTDAFIDVLSEKIEEFPGKSMSVLAREMNVHTSTISRAVTEDLKMTSYALKRSPILLLK